MRTIFLIFVTALFTIIIYNVGRNSYQFEKDEYFKEFLKQYSKIKDLLKNVTNKSNPFDPQLNIT